MNDTSLDNYLGEQLSEAILNQDLSELKEDLIAELDKRDESEPSYNQVPLYTDGKNVLSLYYFESGSVLKNKQLDDNLTALHLVEGKMCFQSDEDVHVHPVAGEVLYLKPGTPFSLQADKPSLLLMIIL